MSDRVRVSTQAVSRPRDRAITETDQGPGELPWSGRRDDAGGMTVRGFGAAEALFGGTGSQLDPRRDGDTITIRLQNGAVTDDI